MTAPHPEAALSAREAEKPENNILGFVNVYFDDDGHIVMGALDLYGTAEEAGDFSAKEFTETLGVYALVPASMLSTAHTATVGDGGDDLDARLKAAGMYTVAEMLGVTPLTKWQTHVGMNSLEFFAAWLDRRAEEFIRMKAGYDLGDKSKDDELYEWVLAHCGAFCEARTNLRAALAASPTPTDAQPKAARPVGDEALRGPTERQLHAAMDAFYPGEDWRGDLGCALETSLRDMRAAIVAANRMAPESHPTTGQETVATPRDGGVREALWGVEDIGTHLWVGPMRPDGIKVEHIVYGHDLQGYRTGAADRVRAEARLIVNSVNAALSAPGSAGPGETAGRQTVDVGVFGPIDGMGNLDKSGAYIGLSASGKATAYGFRISIGAAETLAAELAGILDATPSPAQEPGTGDTGALADIAAERRRQIEIKGYDHVHDNGHSGGDLGLAAMAYISCTLLGQHPGEAVPGWWPWEKSSFKSKGRRHDLIRAGALIVAEIERLDREVESSTEEAEIARILAMTDEEIKAEIIAEGLDPEPLAEAMLGQMGATFKLCAEIKGLQEALAPFAAILENGEPFGPIPRGLLDSKVTRRDLRRATAVYRASIPSRTFDVPSDSSRPSYRNDFRYTD